MRWPFLAAVACCAVLTPVAHAAPPAPQVVDLRNDTPVPSHDVLSARLSSLLVRGRPAIRAELRLAAAPSTPVDYDVAFVAGCDVYAFRLTWSGAARPPSAAFEIWDYCYAAASPLATPKQSFPVDHTVRGTTVTWQMPYAHGVRRGLVANKPYAFACLTPYCVTGPVEDKAEGHTSYVVGSDLPRR